MHRIGRSEFESLFFQDISKETFFSEYWEKKPCVLHDVSGKRLERFFGALEPDERFRQQISLSATDPNSSCSLTIPAPVQGDESEEMKINIPVSAENMMLAYNRRSYTGYIVFQPERLDRDVMEFRTRCLELVGMTGDDRTVLGSYAHLGPASGTSPHFDKEALFQMELAGTRIFSISSEPLDYWCPLSVWPDQAARTPGNLEFLGSDGSMKSVAPSELGWHDHVLNPGDIIYLPATTPHQVTTPKGHSFGVSILARGISPSELFQRTMKMERSRGWNRPTYVQHPNETERANDSQEHYATLAQRWAAELRTSEGAALLTQILASSAPPRVEYCPALREKTGLHVTTESRLGVPENLPLMVSRRNKQGYILELNCGGDVLEFSGEEDAHISERLYDGTSFQAKEACINSDTEETLSLLQTLVDSGVLISQSSTN